jgi:hypothetical protein
MPTARNPRHPHEVRAAGGERIPAGTGDASQGGLQLRILDGGPGTNAVTVGDELALLFRRESLKGFVDAEG